MYFVQCTMYNLYNVQYTYSTVFMTVNLKMFSFLGETIGKCVYAWIGIFSTFTLLLITSMKCSSLTFWEIKKNTQ